MQKVWMSLFVLCSLTACGLRVVPEPVPSGIINVKDNSLTLVKDNISITVMNSDTEIYAYNLEGTVSAFNVIVENQGTKEISFDKDAFLLIDNQGQQYFSLTPEKVREIVSRDLYYLIPYPYVGFYYLEDYKKTSFYNNFNSEIPYFYEVYPQDIYTKALPDGSIIPQAKVSGLVYFKINFSGKQSVKLNVYGKGTSKSSAPDFVFPFKIEK